MLTAYTARMAELLDRHCDVLLVGDSLAQVIYGLPTTLPVTLDMMIAHGAAVVRGSRRALVVVDMPFGSYEENPDQAFRSAARVMATYSSRQCSCRSRVSWSAIISAKGVWRSSFLGRSNGARPTSLIS